MRRPFTWVSGAFLAGIFLAGGAMLTSSPVPVPAAPASAFQAMPSGQQPAAHPAAAQAQAQPAGYTVRSGDTFSSIARRMLGHSDRWPALWYANRRLARNPDVLRPGTWLTLAVPDHPVHAWLAAKAMAAIPKPPEPRPVHPVLAVAATPAASSQAPGNPAAPSAAPVPGSGFEACVIQAESGGNPTAQNPSSTASGLYGFLSTTWTAVTGLPGPARAYSAATQEAAFQKLYSEAGTSPWAAYDGC